MTEKMPESTEKNYPNDAQLKWIKEFKGDPYEWFSQIETIWWMSDWGFDMDHKGAYISTGGWSGNEDIISAMGDNFLMWGLTWIRSRRGGHYRFKITKSARRALGGKADE